jgi:tRNA U34 2-thiouridine synthase MnmA/TrmU
MAKAIALMSGGLDSTLAVLLMRRQNIEVTAVTFLMHFGCDMSDKASCTTDATSLAHRYGFDLKMCHLADKFTEIVKNPKFGHGRNMNPCMDCRILMLREAAELMRMSGADFIVTGEVLGQRPMSQRRDTFPVIDREAGLKGKVLRPLSARLMPPTEAEISALVDRQKLYDFHGRSRKAQIALARELGLEDYPGPAGGCLLTEPNYAFRLKELLSHDPDPSNRDLHLLRVGRHFRMPGGLKLVVGRDEQDNDRLDELMIEGDTRLFVPDVGSPLALIIGGEPSKDDIEFSAATCARYSDAKNDPKVRVRMERDGDCGEVSVAPIKNGVLDTCRINLP